MKIDSKDKSFISGYDLVMEIGKKRNELLESIDSALPYVGKDFIKEDIELVVYISVISLRFVNINLDKFNCKKTSGYKIFKIHLKLPKKLAELSAKVQKSLVELERLF
ncbi:MAG: hypothetical protein GY823_04185 [Flavobacteriaceae bacterium]|nr:hypothetical protein [Flavobacteriaceae bacterium]